MSTKIFVNLPVADLPDSRRFFSALGYSFNDTFSDDNAACLVISDDIFVMLLVRDFFTTFTTKQVADPATHTTAILCLSAESRAGVDELADKALAAGAAPSMPPMDQGPMYGRSFTDLDGHLWEVMWMDMTAATA